MKLFVTTILTLVALNAFGQQLSGSREITLDDAEALLRSRAVRRIAPLTVGSATLSRGALNREVVVLGSTSDLLEVRHMSMGIGRFLPAGDIHESASVCVLGSLMKRELFGNEQAVGQ